MEKITKIAGAFGLIVLVAACGSTKSALPPPPLEPVAEEVSAPVCQGKNYEVYFASDQKTLDKTAREVVDEIKRQTGICQPKAIEIVGHSDSIGSEEVNLMVSQDRADAVLAALLEAELTVERIAIVAAGERDSLTEDETMVPMNRRVDVYFID